MKNEEEAARMDRQRDSEDARTAPADLPVGHRFLECQIAYGVLETEAEDALLAALGVDLTGPTETWVWPFDSWCFDSYDDSFEVTGAKGDWMPTPEQLAAAFALGFERCWINYDDGTERYASRQYPLGERKPNGRGNNGTGKGERIKRLEKRLTASTARVQEVEAELARLKEPAVLVPLLSAHYYGVKCWKCGEPAPRGEHCPKCNGYNGEGK